MKKIYMNPSTKMIIDTLSKRLPQSLMLHGEVGVGLLTIAKYVSGKHKNQTTVILPEKEGKIDIEKGVIGVDIMRQLYIDTRTKTTKKQIVIIDYAERMTHQAQNAFLKLLEEPGINTHFILLSHSTTNILPTIKSRTEKINIKPITMAQTNELLDELKITDKTKRTQMLFIANGLPAELVRLAGDEEYFQKRSAIIRDAREMIVGKMYQKFLIAQRYKDDKMAALRLLLDMVNMLKRNINAGKSADMMKRINDVLNAYNQIEGNGNIRLCLAQIIVLSWYNI